MASSSDIQRSIDSAVSARERWNSELLDLNKQLVNSKGTAKTRLKRAIKNAEDQIKDLDRSISKLTNDLKKVANTEMKQQDNIILAEKGISAGSNIVGSIVSGAKDITGMLVGSGPLPFTDKGGQKSADVSATNMTPENDPNKNKMFLYIGAAVVLLLLLMKKK